MFSIVSYVLVAVIIQIFISIPWPSLKQRAWTLGFKKHNASSGSPQEPPTVFFGLPFLGSLYGLLSRGVSYYETIRDQVKQSVYTTWIVSQKFYIITSPELISKVNRKQQVISSNGPFIQTVYGKILSLDKSSLEILSSPSKHGKSLVKDSHDMYHTVLKPGHSIMEKMLFDTLSKFPGHFHSSMAQFGSDSPVDLMSLLRTSVSMAMADALYGPTNPFSSDSSLMDDFWNFEDGIMMLVMNIFPSWTAAKAVRGRERMVEAFRSHGRRIRDDPSIRGISGLVTQNRDLHQRYECSEDHTARAELGLFLGLTTSLVPALFWLVGKVSSWDEGRLLDAIRNELIPVVQSMRDRKTGKSPGRLTQSLSISTIRAKCPLYKSTIREVLRFTAAGIAAFEVLEDTVLESSQGGRQRRHHLKKGAALQIPATAVHTDESVWGPDAAEFVPQRFMAPDSRSKVHPSAFRAFGGGSTLCPGRHIAEDMMLGMAAVVLTEFDLRFVGPVGLPDPNRSQMTSMMKPEGPCPVFFEARDGYSGDAIWTFTA
ncbi:cholesterol 7alpha-monooxygenase-like protein [Diaporthe eres]|uniref:Cytochrome P450 n=1 Tax=Diaporthe vaccinii TaxID=105482 RepID=A0ABR4FFH9_9PEZI|nr:cholesterol 7alpha-monooxygenase-like protein [Diaporthe eres]